MPGVNTQEKQEKTTTTLLARTLTAVYELDSRMFALGTRRASTSPVCTQQLLQLLSKVFRHRVVQILQLMWVGGHIEELVMHRIVVVPIVLRGKLGV